MKFFLLHRYSYAPDYTEGELFVMEQESANHPPKRLEFVAWTIEREWRNNVPSQSCIPTGDYKVYDHQRPNGDWALRVDGGCCVPYPDSLDPGSGKTRWGILFHAANRPWELQGCVAPGLDRKAGVVTSSKRAMSRLKRMHREHFDMKPATFLIRWKKDPTANLQQR